MPEALTESFCERCGTRYEFRAPTRLNPLRKTRGFVAGLRNYIMSQDAMGDAMGDAMRSEEEGLASAQLDAFHESFNFCIDCRQYTCLTCWNNEAGRCRSCVPVAGVDDLLERMEVALPAAEGSVDVLEPMMEGSELQRRMGLDAWLQADATLPATDGRAATQWPAEDEVRVGGEAEAIPHAEPVAAEAAEAAALLAEVAETEPAAAEAQPLARPEPVLAEAAEAAPLAAEPLAAEPVGAEAAEVEPFAPGPEVAEPEQPIPIRVMAWDEDAVYAPAQVPEAEAQPEPVAPESEPAAEPAAAEMQPAAEPEPIAPEPVTAEPEPEAPASKPVSAPRPRPRPFAPVSETIVRIPSRPEPVPQEPEPAMEPAAATAAETPELAARRAQLDLLGLGDPGQGPVAAQRPNVLPYRSRAAAGGPASMAGATLGEASFWEASAREVAGSAGGVALQNCGECGLALSASARFCRRCGQRQARSA